MNTTTENKNNRGTADPVVSIAEIEPGSTWGGRLVTGWNVTDTGPRHDGRLPARIRFSDGSHEYVVVDQHPGTRVPLRVPRP
jgi:hypothetical protein